MVKKFLGSKYFRSKKNLVQKKFHERNFNFRVKIILVLKNLLGQKKFRVKKFSGQKNLQVKKSFGSKKFRVKKILDQKNSGYKIFGQKKKFG